MFEHFLQGSFIVGLEFCGYSHPKERDAPKWVGTFVSPDPRYFNLRPYKWSLQDDFVKKYCSRYLELAYQFPNQLLDLFAIADADREYDRENEKLHGFHLHPLDMERKRPKFRFWGDRPQDLVSVVQGCVKNIFDVMYVPGGR